ncbi:uncharacterized protein LOC124439271 isoform X2 [Xenia sp. Carnegie-2017]|uniref:uncharacterized protein LOC124439271 isoform X2 n=1 Tax=Xenia sp. Carnegie-2017 TaxID=2897299 RepID=UPI001F040AF4|nr:uncharacterized protein LOC124439271 isoform X2 [Xenia sp. Carnegie-2017]
MVVAKGKAVNGATSKVTESLFEEFCNANDSVEILLTFHKLKASIGAENTENGRELYGALKSKLDSWKSKSLWEVLDARAKHKEYGNQKICEDIQVLVIGSGPIGLRTAIEVALLGAKVMIVEKRTSFSRNNVLHLWPFLIHDFRSLGAKRFYGKFCSGSLDHIGIRILQCLLMKAALILGVQIYTGVTFEKMIEPTSDLGWRCKVSPPFHPASQLDIDMVVGADGKRNVLPNFRQIEMRGSLAIGLTLNLINHGTKEEAAIPEVSGLAYHFKPQFFDELYRRHGVRLENFVYYKGETHYFVMTAVKRSLLAKGALIMDYPKPDDLLAPRNVNTERLIEYALDAVNFGTEGKLTNVEFVVNDRNAPDIAVFDFTSLKKAEHAARIVERKGHRLLMALVGDSLIEPFWPTGSGCARGVLSALDTAWMLRSFAMDRPPLQILSERENVYKLLSATTTDNLNKKFDSYTINPFTRYLDRNMNKVKEVYHLYDTDDPVSADFRLASSIIENTKRRMSTGKLKKKQRKSSSDNLEDKKEKTRQRKSSSDRALDDNKKEKTNRKKSAKKKLNRSKSRDTDSELTASGIPTNKKDKLKKMGSQSSESGDEKELRGARQRKLDRAKSRDAITSQINMDTIKEGKKVAPTRNTEREENQNNSVLMKQRSTTRWNLFRGTKTKLQSSSSTEKDEKSYPEKNMTRKKSTKKITSRTTQEVTTDRKHVNDKITKPSGGITFNKTTASPELKNLRKMPVVENSNNRVLREQIGSESSAKRSPYSFRKPTQAVMNNGSGSFKTANNGVVPPSSMDIDVPKMQRTSTLDKERKTRVKGEEPGKEKEIKRMKFDTTTREINNLSPAAMRTEPLLKTLTPDRERSNYGKGGAVTAAAGLAAMVALTTPLAIDSQNTRYGSQRDKILASSKVSVQEKIALLNSASTTNKRTRRDLSKDLDSVDGNLKPIRRHFTFATARNNVKKTFDGTSKKTNTLPRQVFSRPSIEEMTPWNHGDIPTALDHAINILTNSYNFADLKGTMKMMLNIFRCISKDPDDETPRRIWSEGQLFRSLVWNVNEAKLFMIVSGWMEFRSFIVFPKTKTPHEPIRILMQNYRKLWDEQVTDSTMTQAAHFSDSVVKRRRLSDITFQEKVEFAQEDAGSISGSDSGMGFSETASEQNVAAILPPDDDVTHEVSNYVNNAAGKRTSQIMNPSAYLDASYRLANGGKALNPSHYLDESTHAQDVNKGQGNKFEVDNFSETLLFKEDQNLPKNQQDVTTTSHDHLIGNVRQRFGDVLDETNIIPEVPEDTTSLPPLKEENEITGTLEDPVKSNPVVSQSESSEQDSKSSSVPMKQSSNEQISTRGSGRENNTLRKQPTELDELFDTLDFVADVLEPPQVIYDHESKKNNKQSKKNRASVKSNATSRRREEFARSKSKGMSTEESVVETKRKTRNQTNKDKQLSRDTSVDKNGHLGTRRDLSRSAKYSEFGQTNYEDYEKNNHTATTTDTKPLRRSQRIAKSSSNGKTVLDTSDYPDDSSTDLNKAFVESNIKEQSIHNDSTSHTQRKKKVRRQSSIVKSNKSRVHTKRNGHKPRKDRSVDL